MASTTLPTLSHAGDNVIIERVFRPEVEAELEAICKRYPERRAALLPALRLCEREFGCVDHGGMKLVAERLGLTPAYVQATVSFYTHFRRPGEGTFIIEVCRTLPCALRGADDFVKLVERKLGIKMGQTTSDGLFTLKNAECMAACDKAPVCQVNGYNWELLEPKAFDDLVDALKKDPKGFDLKRGIKDPHPWTKAADKGAARTKPEGQRDFDHEALTHDPVLLKRCYRGKMTSYEEYVRDGGYVGLKEALKLPPQKVIETIKESGLRGRGGAGFPTGVKFGFVPTQEKNPGARYFVINADESEPGTFKDRRLMEEDPHPLLEGIAIACHAIGANDAYIYIRGEMVLGAELLEVAVKEAYAKGVFGPDALGFGKRLDCTVHRGAGAYICGEETALLSSLEGGRGYPRIKPPFPANKGAWARPTIVNNVETIMNLPLIFSKGLQWYTALGTPPSPPGKYSKLPKGGAGSRGPKVWCVSGHVKRPGLYDVPFGVSLKTLIMDERFCGGLRDGRKLKGVVPGGSSFQILKADECDVPLCFDAVAEAGSSCGSAGVIVFDDSTCIVNALLNILRFYAHESCGQCTPCREGSGWMMKVVDRIERGQGTMEDLATIDAIADQACGKTICVFAEAFSWPAQSYIAKFKDEFVAHIKQGRCPSGGRLCAPMSAPTTTAKK